MGWRLLELCSGCAALSLHLLGWRRQLVPYMGSKWRLRRELSGLLDDLGFAGQPDSVHLNDVGPAAQAAATAIARPSWVAATLNGMLAMDPLDVYEDLNGSPPSDDRVQRAAEFLFLQRLAWSGKPVGIRDGRWAPQGFNGSSAYGVAATDKFGEVNPMVPSLVRLLHGVTAGPATWSELPASDVDIYADAVYIDPPYRGTTDYPCGGMSRGEVVSLALKWADRGSAVIVSEAEVVGGLIKYGFDAKRLSSAPRRMRTRAAHKRREEWVTFTPPDGR